MWLNDDNYHGFVGDIIRRGPNRALVDRDGAAGPPSVARREGIPIQSILIRDDGWSLGFPVEWESAAWGMAPNDWRYKMVRTKELGIWMVRRVVR